MTKYVLAEKIIEKAFAERKDLSGSPYIYHLRRVREGLLKQWSNAYDRVQIAAMLHDILEDCPEWNETSLRQIFDNDTVDIVVILTKGKKEDYDHYIERIMLSNNNHAKMIKIADLRDNMDITRLDELDEKSFKRLQKYLSAYKKLTESPNLKL